MKDSMQNISYVLNDFHQKINHFNALNTVTSETGINNNEIITKIKDINELLSVLHNQFLVKEGMERIRLKSGTGNN